MDKNNKRSWVKPVAFTLLTLYLAATTAAYSFIGETNNRGDFVVNQSHRLVLIALTILSAAITAKLFVSRKK